MSYFFCDSKIKLLIYFFRKIILMLFLKSLNKIPIRLETSNSLLLTSVFSRTLAAQNEQLLRSVSPSWLFLKTCIDFTPISSYHWDISTIRFFFHLNNLHLVGSTFLVLLKMMPTHDIYFSRCSVAACRKRSHFNSRVFLLDFTWNCCRLLEADKFSRNPGQLKWVTRETRCHISIPELLKQNLMCQVAELFRRPSNHAKNTLF